MLYYLILLFTVVPVIELALLIRVGQSIGLMNTVTLVIVTGVIGAYMARAEGLRTLINIQNDINSGTMPAERLFDGVLILCGGLLLLTPGLITDAIGFMCLFPMTRTMIKVWLREKAKRMIDRGDVITIRR